ncbi:class III extradiol dioxygenase subunit B-like domain-containing protein [Dactylosporangium roseum]|uniref:Class III extradiol dioxygenase subunit B-like domain-containing protein n=1 Tax=Dactylosporangium roseum TaxID=47989 RepID=A0ABY5Z890_9ACTN|nr:class III extradiol dioxygenase subunit B-like domain-containing protein [Dactylosporangium roseum]UWZ38301.1 class III extradiol dioxygenase subunit B-like domain-containing protein [Dactylosporangium roseum]
MSLVAAAVCPHPPLLVPEVAAGAASELDGLRAACRAAMAHLANASVDSLIVVGADTTTVRRHAPFGGTLSPWGIDLPVGTPGGDPLPLSLLIGAWLAPRAGAFQSVASTASPDECAELGRSLAAEAERVGLLVLGDASACRSEKAPAYLDPRAAGFDAAVADALAEADTRALMALDPVLADELLVAGRAPWQVLAGAAGDEPRHAELLYDDAPYGVGYLVASWR